MIRTEPRFADSELVEIAEPEVETKTLILLGGKKDTTLPSLWFCNKLFHLCCALCIFCTRDKLNSTDNNDTLHISSNILFWFKCIEVDSNKDEWMERSTIC